MSGGAGRRGAGRDPSEGSGERAAGGVFPAMVLPRCRLSPGAAGWRSPASSRVRRRARSS